MASPHQLKTAVSEYSLALHERGWVANHDGNVSARLGGEERFLITPTAVSKRRCSPDTIVTCDMAGKPLGRGKPPSEVALHVGAYRARSDAKAVIHAHPPHASAFALARVAIDEVAMPEVVVSLGDRVPLVPMLLPKDPASGDAVAKGLEIADVLLLAGNGVLAIGEDLEQAYLRVELLEHYARILAVARSIGGPAPLEAEAKKKLLEMRAAAGLGPKPCPKKAAAREAAAAKTGTELRSTILPIVAEEVRRALGGSK